MKNNFSKSMTGYFLIAPMMAGCLLFYVIPFGMVIYYSFQSGVGRRSTFVGLNNYFEIIQNELFQLACWNTLRFLIIGLPAILLISYGIAWILKKQTEKYLFLKSVLLLPYTMPVAGTVILIDVFVSDNGILNFVRDLAGVSAEKWMESSGAFWIVVFLYLWKNTGYSVIILLSGLLSISEEQYHSAQMDGASGFQQFRYITMPQMRQSVFFAVLFSMMNAFKCFREIFLIGGEHPNPEIYMLQHYINNSFENFHYNNLAVASILIFLIIAIIVGSSFIRIFGKEV